jgi:hypothetical protein
MVGNAMNELKQAFVGAFKEGWAMYFLPITALWHAIRDLPTWNRGKHPQARAQS